MLFIEDNLPLFMFVALALLLFTGFPVAMVLSGVGLAFGYFAVSIDLINPIQLSSIVNRIFGGIVENLVLVAIPMFIFMGTMLEKSGVAEDLLHALQVLLRRVPGGLALAVTLMGTVMAATTGIIGASVVMMTLLALPVMMNRGYSTPLATGTIAASGTLGILIPPSIMLVIMGDLLSISVGTLFIAAIIPGFLLSLFYLIFIVVTTAIKPELAPPLPSDEGPQTLGGLAMMALTSFVPPLMLIVLVLGSIFGGFATPTEASGVGALGATALAVAKRRLSFAVLREVVERTALTGAMLFFIFVGATAFSLVFRLLGGDDFVIGFIDAFGFGSWGILFVLMGTVFFLGFFFDWIEITLIVLPIFTPIVRMLDFGDHVGSSTDVVFWFAILVAVNLQTSFLTPPFGFALFYMKGVAPPEVRIQSIYKGIIPFVLLQLVGLGLVLAFPQLALWLPSVVFD
ncbi:MAG: TRAP transporter large permease [Alphaproteobacteria bacterium]